MSAHTEGPWIWMNNQTDEPFNFDVEWDGEGYPSLRTAATSKRPNSNFDLPAWILDAEPMQNGNDTANARLIAAAPELLAALKALVNAADNLDPQSGVPIGYQQLLDAAIAADAAIAKATGAAS